MLNDCIAAISTPPGVGALAIVRMSGDGCIEIIERLFRGEGRPGEIKGRGILVGKVYDPEAGKDVDEVVLSVFREPGSYTGEDMVEICRPGRRYVSGDIPPEWRRGENLRGGHFSTGSWT
jgi:tRNA U34 5-carboxymethylaminomethyl modifying GTPase MnmE/TrmE